MRWVSLLLGIKHKHKKKNMDYLRSSVPIFVSAFVNSNFDINFEIPLALPIEVIYPRKFSKVDAHQWENTVAGLRSRQRREAAEERRGRQEEQAASQSSSDQASTVQSTVGSTHQESDSAANNENATQKIDHQPSKNYRVGGISHPFLAYF